ncbi:uncharacterized protein MICPUCDRAFT_48559 [Micromonas pusilla CCMP1545]|uniref:Predicted protein n=1 Tax=Micromonas pusilla (strain CCMP1545) TaxID=564608 RepID=C1N3H1_MICPC|nr:uncharacterized protein MICPUCDRAFT_48559 [Micromonas pusilla CCMP1545]EEH53430.1 predicted protein [Micromonas pusilla CCMP1545]|eukprot:XP_003062611.1 predicted protein [Micromonas pusilla CCMP1545]
MIVAATDDGGGPSGFSVVRDSIARDREALFGATRAHIPTIAADDSASSSSAESGDESDGELPIFFSSRASDDATTTTTTTSSTFSAATRRAAPASARADADDDAAALAAFERAATASLAREEARSAAIVAEAHASFERGGDPGYDDDDESTDARAKRRPHTRGATSRGASRPASAPPARAFVAPPNAMGELFSGWLSGAAGRLARDDRGGTGGGDDDDDRMGAFPLPPATPRDVVDVDALEREFARATRGGATLDADGGDLPSDVASAMPPPSVTLDVDGPRGIGGIDLDALLARLSTPEGLRDVEAARSAVGVDDVIFEDDDDGSLDEGRGEEERAGAATRGGGDAGERDEEGWTKERRAFGGLQGGVSRGRGRGDGATRPPPPPPPSRPSTARNRAGGPTPSLDPYGRGTSRTRRREATAAGRGGAGASVDAAKPPLLAPFTFPRVGAPEPTVRVDARRGAEEPEPEPEPVDSNSNAAPPPPPPVDDSASDSGDSDSDDDAWRKTRRAAKPSVAAKTAAATAAAAAERATAKASAAARAASDAASRASAAAAAREEEEHARAKQRATILAAKEAAMREAVAAARDEAEAAAAAARAKNAAAAAEADAAEAEKALETARSEIVDPSGGDVAAMHHVTPGPEWEEDAERSARAEERRLAGNDAFRRGDYRRAVDEYSASLRVKENDANALANRAAAFLRLEDYDAAETDATRCLRADPGHDKARHRRATARRAKGDVAGALADLETLRARLPHHAAVTKDYHDVRRLASHLDPAKAAAAMEAHQRERREAEEEAMAAWERRRDEGLRAHKARAQSARGSRPANR